MWNKRLSQGLLAVLLLGLVPGSGLSPRPAAGLDAPPPPPLAVTMPALAEARIQEAAEPYVDLDLLVTGTDAAKLRAQIEAEGGTVTVQEQTFVRVRVPTTVASSVTKLPGVKGVGVNQPLQIDPTGVAAQDHQVGGAEAARAAVTNYSPIGVDAFRSAYGVDGSGIIVAVIDSGIDPGHPALQTTPDGRPKLIDWKDFTREGYVSTTQPVDLAAGSYTTRDQQTYELPPDLSGRAFFGYLDEQYVTGYINQDLDRNGLKIDRFGALVTRGGAAYDTVYIDTNHDYSFADEQPLTVYRNSHAFTSLGEYRAGERSVRRLNVIAADIDPAGQFVRLGFDGLGHGTQVAGVLGAAAPNGGFQGAAPGVQIMALKALRSTGAGEWFDIKEAVLYAARNGAQIINLSVGDLATGAAKAFDTGASEWLNQVAAQYGVLIVLAAGNSGPGLSSGATLGSPSQVMAAGAYFSSEMWLRDYGWSVPHETVWFFSGMGPRSDGTYLPSVIAPGGSPTTSPFWRDGTGYATAVGTSIATPHVSAAAALLMEAGANNGIAHDWLSVKRALEMGARRIAEFEVYEQGSGLIQLRAAYSHLERINSLPALKARTPDGMGGILARSYAPGSTVFALTNQDDDAARVGIYSSEPWIRPALTSMLLPGNVSRSLPLQFAPPKEPGAHSAFVMVTQQNKYGTSLLLPVTHVQPLPLDASNDYSFSRLDTLEAGRYRRYFFDVQPGSASLTVTARMPFTNGTIQVHAFRPDGQVLHTGKVGLNGQGLSTLFQADDPIPGVWEVVVVALPDAQAANANPVYNLDVKARPGALGTQPLRYTLEPGQTATFPLKVSNLFGNFTGAVEAEGLTALQNPADAWTESEPWHVEFKSSNIVETFTTRELLPDLQLEISNPVRSDLNVPLASDADLSLYLYRSAPDGSWEQKRAAVTPGTSHETIQMTNLPAGTYRVVVTSTNGEAVQYQYRRLMGVHRYQVKVQDEPRRHAAGEPWNASLTITAPTIPGRYAGYLLIRDTVQQRVLGWYPFEVSVGQPTLRIQPMDAQLTRNRPSAVVFELRDSRTNQLVPGAAINVNGQRYLSVNGTVSVQIVPQADQQPFDVEADVPAYQYVKQQFTLPVRDAWGIYPLGIDKNQENANWRRKVTNQLPAKN